MKAEVAKPPLRLSILITTARLTTSGSLIASQTKNRLVTGTRMAPNSSGL